MTRTRTLVAALAALVVIAPPSARAESGALFGESPRAAGLAGAVTGAPGGTWSVHFNPGALVDLDRPTFGAWAHTGDLSWSLSRTGEAAEEQGAFVGGFGLALATPFPGPEWLRHLHAGFGLHVPMEHALAIDAPPRSDIPALVLYENRAERLSLSVALALELFDGVLGLGGGIQFAPALVTPTRVLYDPGDADRESRVLIDLERELPLGTSADIGLRVRPIEDLSFGVAFHQQVLLRAEGSNDTRAGGIRLDDPIDFAAFLEPDELVFGAWWRPVDRLAISADVSWARWSAFVTIHDQKPDPGFDDTMNVRVGLEAHATDFLEVRGGWAFEPSPVPEQVGITNFVDADRHVITLGAGLDLAALHAGRARFDVHARTVLFGTASATKDRMRLQDDDAETPGVQIGNLGFPAWEGRAFFWEVGIGMTVPLGRDPEAVPDEEPAAAADAVTDAPAEEAP